MWWRKASALTRLGTFLLAVTLCALMALPAQAITRTVSVPAPAEQLKGEDAVTGETACTGVLPFPLDLRNGLFAANNPVNLIDPSGHEFSIAGINVATAIQYTLRTMAYGAIIGGAVGQWDAIIGGRDSLGGLKEGAISGALLGPFARFRVIQLLGISYGAVQTGIAIGEGQNGLATYRAVVTAGGAALFVAGDVYVSKVSTTPRYTVADVRAAIARLEAKGIKPNEFQSHIDPDNVIRIAELMRSGEFDPALMRDPVIFETTSKSLLSGHHRSIAAEMAGLDLPQAPTAAPGTQAGEWSEIPLIPGRRN